MADVKVCGLVLGMHNSGTSLAAALLDAAGAPMGPRLMVRQNIAEATRPAYDYLEDRDAVALNDELLCRLGRHWSSYRSSWPMPDRNQPDLTAIFTDYEERLLCLIKARLGGGSSLWVVKDPRIAILLPSWLAVLHQLEVQPRIVVVHRDASTNIRSFSVKGQVPWLWAEALWQRTYTEIFRIAAIQRQLISFQSLLSEPHLCCERMVSFLGHRPRSGWQDRVSSVVQPSLQKFQADSVGEEQSGCSGLTLAMQECLDRGEFPKGNWPEEDALLSSTLQQWLEPHPLLQLHSALPPRNDGRLRKRVALVTPELQGFGSSGGIGTAFLELGLALRQAGHLVEVLLVGGGEDRRAGPAADLPVRQIHPGDASLHDLSLQLARELAGGRYDIVHGADWLGLSRGFRRVLSADASPQLVCGIHGCTTWIREATSPPSDPAALDHEADVEAGEIQAMAEADWLVSPSQALSQWLQRQLPEATRPERPTLVQQNLPAQRIAAAESPPEQPNSLIFYGRLEERKGIDLFLDALERLPSAPEAVHLVGSDVVSARGSHADKLLRRLAAMGLHAEHHNGLDRDAARLLVRTLGGVIVIASLIENSPYSVQEFLGSGLRLVCTAVGGIPELVHEPDGKLPNPDPDALANALAEALKDGPSADRYRLEPSLPADRIRLSWQAFHEALQPAIVPPTRVWPDPVLPQDLRFPKGVLMITLDSCRYDTFAATSTPHLDQVGPLHKAQAPSYFTYGSHAAMFMGFLPGITESEPFLNSKFSKLFRLGHAAFQATKESQAFLLDGNSIITGMRRLGYTTIGTGAVNWFDPSTETGQELSKDFDHFWFAGDSWSLQRQLDWIEERLRGCGDNPPFVFMNVGETHVPYWHEGASWDRADNPCLPFQTLDRASDCRQRQCACLAWVDQQLGLLLERFLDGTVVVCADHGDCWGENGLWEHGIAHPQTLTVPLLMRVHGQPVCRQESAREQKPGRDKRALQRLLRAAKKRLQQPRRSVSRNL